MPVLSIWQSNLKHELYDYRHFCAFLFLEQCQVQSKFPINICKWTNVTWFSISPLSPLVDMTLFLSPSGYFSSCLWVSGSRSPSWCHLTGHPVYTRSSPPPWTTQALWSPFPAHYCSTGCMGLKRGPQILPSSSLQEAEGATPAQPLSEAGLRSSLSQTEVKVCGLETRA